MNFNNISRLSLKEIYKLDYSINTIKNNKSTNTNKNVKYLIWLLKQKSDAGFLNSKYKKLSEEVYKAYTQKNKDKKEVLNKVLKTMSKIKDKSKYHKDMRNIIRQTVYKLNPNLIEEDEGKITVNIYWIRHAYSCGNIMEYFGKVLNMPEHAPDTPLSGLGILQATILGLNPETRRILENADFYGCSTLTRTLQTGLFGLSNINIHNDKMHIVPYINEKFVNVPSIQLKTYVSRSTTPLCYNYGIECHKNIFKQVQQQIIGDKMNLDWDIFKTVYPNDEACKQEDKITSNYKRFLNDILPQIIAKCSNDPTKKEYNICLFSHGKYIRSDVLKNPDEGVYNTGIYKKVYYYQNGSLIHEKMQYTRVYPPSNFNSNNMNKVLNRYQTKIPLSTFRISLPEKFNNNYQLFKDLNSELFFYANTNINADYIPIILTKKHSGEDKDLVKKFYINNAKLLIGDSNQSKTFSQNGSRGKCPIKNKNDKPYCYTEGCFINIRKILAPQSIKLNTMKKNLTSLTRSNGNSSIRNYLLVGGSKKRYLFITGIGQRRIYKYKNGKDYIKIKGKKLNLDKIFY